ncbi:MAG: serine hydroxymethyltransferase [Candidatus Nealsonbacteria bacterium]|nr:serine hydroxymethyltransferase [Candidatus Nealsonbacteria bacterium]
MTEDFNMLKKTDPKIAKLIEQEQKRHQDTVDLIASENYPSKSVREALGSIFVVKYAEGRPHKRYYGGQEYIDKLETLAEERALKAFKLDSQNWAVNVQPLSGAPANYEILRGLLDTSDKILCLHLPHGGHLSQGSKASLSGQDFTPVYYYLNKDGFLDYESIEELAVKEKPKLIIAGYTAYPRIIDFEKFGKIAKKVGAYLLTDTSHITGLIIGGVHPSPFPWTDVLMTTTHKTLRGPRGAMIICRKELEEKIFPKVFPGLQGGPHMHTIAALGVALGEALTPAFKKYARQIVKNAGISASELKKYGFDLVSGGTDNHLVLIDLRNKNITGKHAQELLEKAGIVTNKNTIPYDPGTPFDPSGIRLGTPAVTTRGMKEKEMKLIAGWINEVINNPGRAKEIRKKVEKLCSKFLIP